MANRNLSIENLSDHDLKIVGTYGDNFNGVTTGKVLAKNQDASTSCKIGEITEPSMFTPSHWGWIYLEDVVNHSQIELFAYVDNRSKNEDRAASGWRSWNCGGRRDPNNGIRIPDPYLKASHGGNDFTFTIEQIPTDTESYMFNMGRYQCGYGPTADHVFVIVRDYDGNEEFFFDCHGGHGDNPSEKQSLDPCRVSCRGGSRSLKLAKAICCLNPEDSRTEFSLHDGGKLGNGDSSGILFGATGVCHQMANRIFAAGVDEPTIDALDFADVRMGNVTREWFGPWGVDVPVDKYLEEIRRIFPQNTPDILPWNQIKAKLVALEKASIPLDWKAYFEYCRTLV